jgi:hypothetical protein
MALGKIPNSSNTSRKIILLYFGKKKKESKLDKPKLGKKGKAEKIIYYYKLL